MNSKQQPRRGISLVLVGPSGSGKTSIMNGMVSGDSQIRRSISVTTRRPRPGERDGVDYYFITHQAFDRMVAADVLLEHTRVYGDGYGTPLEPAETFLQLGLDVIFVLDVRGCRELARRLPDDVVSVLIQPPSLDVLQVRMLARGDDPASVERRMKRDCKLDEYVGAKQVFQHTVFNSDLGDAVNKVHRILRRARQAKMDPAVRRAALDELASLSEEYDF